jgi:hypothetical protein
VLIGEYMPRWMCAASTQNPGFTGWLSGKSRKIVPKAEKHVCKNWQWPR